MNIYAIQHLSDSNYCFPISKNELKLRLRVQKDDDIKSINCVWNVLQDFYCAQKQQMMHFAYSDELFDYYEVTLFSQDPRFAYVFLITLKDGKNYYYSEFGVSESYDFSLFYLTSFRLPYINSLDIVEDNPTFSGDVFYQIFPERFNSMDKNIDKSFVNMKWDSKDMRGSNQNRKQDSFLGGDFEGIIQKLDYLSNLGIDTIYLTPICKSNTNHKYDVIDYLKIDDCFGGESKFLELCNKIHEKKMKIVIDLVFNHSSNLNPMFQDIVKNGKKSKYYDYYYINGDKPIEKPLNYSTFGMVPSMPKLNSNCYDEMDYFVKVGKYYIENFKVDGYRLDVANEVSHVFWNNFKFQLRKIKPDIILIGECWNNASSYLSTNEFESVMNYPFFLLTKEFYVTHLIDEKQYAEKLNGLLVRYTDGNNKMMLNLLDSHDTERFYNFVKPNKDLYLLSILSLISYIGWPMIYYGDEIFMEGGTDPDNRRGMEWNSANFSSKYFELFKDIVQLRKISQFRNGEIKIYSKDKLFIIERFDKKDIYKVIINNSKNDVLYKLDGELILKNNYTNNILGNFGFLVVKL